MNTKIVLACGLAVSVLASPAAQARDIWDLTGNDGSAATRSEIAPGALQVHDLEGVSGVADQDWFRISEKPYSSYEVLVDGLTGGLAPVPVTVPGTELGVHFIRDGVPPCPRTPWAHRAPRACSISATRPAR